MIHLKGGDVRIRCAGCCTSYVSRRGLLVKDVATDTACVNSKANQYDLYLLHLKVKSGFRNIWCDKEHKQLLIQLVSYYGVKMLASIRS